MAEVVNDVVVGRRQDKRRIYNPVQTAVAPKNSLHRGHDAADEPVVFLVELRPGHIVFELETRYYQKSRGRRTDLATSRIEEVRT